MPVKSITRKPARTGKSLNTDLYIGLLRQALPLPPQTEADNERLIGLLSALSEREELGDLNAEEQAFTELLAIVIEDFEDRHYSLPAVAPDEFCARSWKIEAFSTRILRLSWEQRIDH